MSRLQIVIASVAFIVVWVAVKWMRDRARRGAATPKTFELDEVNRWYAAARETIASLEPEERVRREARWEAFSKSEKLALTEEFLRGRFGQSAPRAFTRDEKLALGKAHLMSRG
jgi:hypothetical protein